VGIGDTVLIASLVDCTSLVSPLPRGMCNQYRNSSLDDM